MARNELVNCPAGSWTQLTNAAVTGDVSMALIDGTAEILATAGATPPADDARGLPVLSHGDGFSEATIAEKFPGVASADRLWAKPLTSDACNIYITHG